MDKDKEIKLTPGVKRSLKSILKKVELYRKDELLLELEKASTKGKLLFLSSWSIEYRSNLNETIWRIIVKNIKKDPESFYLYYIILTKIHWEESKRDYYIYILRIGREIESLL